MNLRTFFQIYFLHSIDAKFPLQKRPMTSILSEIANINFHFTFDPRKHNDDTLMKKVIGDNEKFHLLQQLLSNTTCVSHKLEIIKKNSHDIRCVNVDFDDLFREFIISSDI